MWYNDYISNLTRDVPKDDGFPGKTTERTVGMTEIHAPKPVCDALRLLHQNGFSAYAVGGCVRDSLLGLSPEDWDLTTSARPEETERVFADFRVVETGLRHGTVTVLAEGLPLEITTYRIDGAYADMRRPEQVTFSTELREDLARRDFTVNTLCWSEETGVLDLFEGLNDLRDGVLRTVGNADKRFSEDALRILRCIRFASTLGFQIEDATSDSLLFNRFRLQSISAERIRAEFTKLLCGKHASKVLEKYRSVVEVFIPELSALVGCAQNTPYHCYDVLGHTLCALDHIEPTEILRLCMFFHDFGKPICRRTDENGRDHFKGHGAVSVGIAEAVLKRLRYDHKTVEEVTTLVRIHDTKAPRSKAEAKRLLAQIGVAHYRALVKIKRADTRAKADPHALDERLERMEALLEEILQNGECYSISMLAINGNDLQAAGVPYGQTVRAGLEGLLDAVIDGRCPNEKDALLRFLQKNLM